MSIILHKIGYLHADNVTLFHDVSCTINKGEKIALVGRNGSGKSTLLRIAAGLLPATEGSVTGDSLPYYVPQHVGQYDELRVAEALGIAPKLQALLAIEAGEVSEKNLAMLNDDWDIEERCLAALSAWGLEHVGLGHLMGRLSGGEKTKVFLAGLLVHLPEAVLLDEPTNHLDGAAREQLYNWIESTRASLLVVSHDIMLLRRLPITYELTEEGITVYGGNYDFYKEQKALYMEGLQASLEEKEKELRLAKRTARETAERKQKHEARGKKHNEKSNVGKMAMNIYQDQAEKSASKLKGVHAEKAADLTETISQLRAVLPDGRQMKVSFESPSLHTGKVLVKAEGINFSYDHGALWKCGQSFMIRSGDRLAISGGNGRGKTTLIKLITGELMPMEGVIERSDFSYVYIDQDYSLVKGELTVYEQAETFNNRQFEEHEVKMLLSRYLFPSDSWDTPCSQLSGGEKMRLVFCCLMIANQAPDVFVLDEPTNNLDIGSVEIITSVIKEYKGTVLVVSHDGYFVEEIGIFERIEL